MNLLKWKPVPGNPNAWWGHSGGLWAATVYNQGVLGFRWEARLTFGSINHPTAGDSTSLEEAIAAAETYWSELLSVARLKPDTAGTTGAPSPSELLGWYQFDEHTWLCEFDALCVGRVERIEGPYEDENDGLWSWRIVDAVGYRVMDPETGERAKSSGGGADLAECKEAVVRYFALWLDSLGLAPKAKS